MSTSSKISSSLSAHKQADFEADPRANLSAIVREPRGPVRLTHRAARQQRLAAFAFVCPALLVLLAPASAVAQAASEPSTIASSAPTTSQNPPRFEIGLQAAAAPVTNDQPEKVFAGLSAAFAVRPWLAIGTEMDTFSKVALGDNIEVLREAQPHYILSGYQALMLGELRLALVNDVVRLFGRAAVGPASVTHIDDSTAVVLATKTSVGVDLRLKQFYVRPFGFVATIATEGAQLGFGLEAGATF